MTIDDFRKVDLRVGRILSAERVEGSEKLVKLMIDLAEVDLPAGRQVLAGVGKVYEPKTLVGREIVVVANLESRKIMGLESNGMLLAANDENGNPVILAVEHEVRPGAKIQ